MEYALICVVAVLASGLTLVTGFGLGTLLLPAFALFFSVDLAIAMTALVHLANSLFKLMLLGQNTHRPTLVCFGIPAMLAALAGAGILIWLGELPPILEYTLHFSNNTFYKSLTLVKLVIGLLMIFFATMEIIPKFKGLAFEPKHMPIGGIISGFLGGLSGHQGALRSAFLSRSGLNPTQFVSTSAAIACLVDLARLGVYSGRFRQEELGNRIGLISLACLSAFIGAHFGSKFVKRLTISGIQRIVAIGLILMGVLMSAGMI